MIDGRSIDLHYRAFGYWNHSNANWLNLGFNRYHKYPNDHDDKTTPAVEQNFRRKSRQTLKNLQFHNISFHPILYDTINAWWRHQMETFSAWLAICAGNSPVPGEFPAHKPVTRSFDVFFDLRKRLSKQSWGWWFETLSRPLWRHRNGTYQERRIRTVLRDLPVSWWQNLCYRQIVPCKDW